MPVVTTTSTFLFNPTLYITYSNLVPTLRARSMEPTWGPPGAGRTQVGPMLATWTLLSGDSCYSKQGHYVQTRTDCLFQWHAISHKTEKSIWTIQCSLRHMIITTHFYIGYILIELWTSVIYRFIQNTLQSKTLIGMTFLNLIAVIHRICVVSPIHALTSTTVYSSGLGKQPVMLSSTRVMTSSENCSSIIYPVPHHI